MSTNHFVHDPGFDRERGAKEILALVAPPGKLPEKGEIFYAGNSMEGPEKHLNALRGAERLAAQRIFKPLRNNPESATLAQVRAIFLELNMDLSAVDDLKISKYLDKLVQKKQIRLSRLAAKEALSSELPPAVEGDTDSEAAMRPGEAGEPEEEGGNEGLAASKRY